MESRPAVRSVLLGSAGLDIDGGIACVGRCIARALDDAVRDGRLERADRVTLHDRAPTREPPVRGVEWTAAGSQVRFARLLWQARVRHRHDLVIFDFCGLARVMALPLPGIAPRELAVFTHAFELFGHRVPVLRRATCLLANSRFSAKVLRDLVPGAEVETVYLCVDPAREHAWSLAGPPPAAARREAAVLIVARMASVERCKGHDTLLEAWPAVRAEIPGAELWIAGQGDDRPRLEQLARQRAVADSVRFLGLADSATLGQLYRRAAVYAMPSRQEGFGIAFAEAMWHALPCIGTTADASGEVIVHGETGLLIEYGDASALAAALRQLLRDAELRERMGSAGCSRAREHFVFARFRERLGAVLGIAPAA